MLRASKRSEVGVFIVADVPDVGTSDAVIARYEGCGGEWTSTMMSFELEESWFSRRPLQVFWR